MQGMGEEIMYGLQSKWRGGYFRDRPGSTTPAFATIARQLPRGCRRATRWSASTCSAAARSAGSPPDATAFVHRAPLHYISVIALWQGDEETDANVAWVDDFVERSRRT